MWRRKTKNKIADKDNQIKCSDIIGKLSREDYMSKFAQINDLNYWIASFTGVLEFDESKKSWVEKEKIPFK